MWSSLGLYPAIPGVGGLAVTSPLFSSGTIRAAGRTITIETTGSGEYVRWLTVDGRPYARTWLSLPASRDLTLRYTLARRPQQWGSSPEAAPPSFEAP